MKPPGLSVLAALGGFQLGAFFGNLFGALLAGQWLSIWCGQPSAEAAFCSAERLSFSLDTAYALAASAQFCARSVDEAAQVDEKIPSVV